MASTREFNGVINQPSTGLGGPDQIEADLDKLFTSVNDALTGFFGISVNPDGSVNDVAKTYAYLTELIAASAAGSLLGALQITFNGSTTETVQAQLEELGNSIGDRSAFVGGRFITANQIIAAAIEALDNQLADVTDNKADTSDTVSLTQPQTISGSKTFTVAVECNQSPFINAHLTRKDYVDNLINPVIADYVSKTLAQSIGGSKTFTTQVSCDEAPTFPEHLTRKDYVDNLVGPIASDYVSKTLAETISGTKTFTVAIECNQSPIISSHLTRKDYVDGLIGTCVTIAGTQVISGEKTFTLAPSCSATPTLDEHLTRKDYVDTKAVLTDGTVTIPTTGWVANTGFNSLKLDLAIVGILATDYVKLSIIDPDDQEVAGIAQINPTITEYNGGVTLYANTAPTSSIDVKWEAIR